MAKAAIWDYSTTAASNTDIDGVDSTGTTGLVKSGDNYARSMMAHSKGFALDLGSVNTVAGTANAITVTLSAAPSALVDGMRITINATAANTGATTINVTPAGGAAFGAKKVMKWSAGSEAELSAGDIPAANALVELIYDSARNAAAGAWMLHGTSVAASSTTDVLTGTGTSNYATPKAIAALWEKGSDEASAGTVAFGEGGYFHVTGTTTITDIDFDTAKDGRTVDVIFDDALTLTHNGTTLKLPGGANIVTAAGDRARFVQDSTDNVICLHYQRAGGVPAAYVMGTPVSLSGSDVDFTGIPPWAKWFELTFSSASTNGTAIPQFQIGDAGGIEATGYLGSTSIIAAASSSSVNATTGVRIPGSSWAAANIAHGIIRGVLQDAATNNWVIMAQSSLSNTTVNNFATYTKPLSAVLTQCRLSTTDTWDGGAATLFYGG
jgi:hypothetical protein